MVLGGFYILVALVFLFFEEFVINYRPVLINGFLEASYPSSTTLLALCVISTPMLQIRWKMKNGIAEKILLTVCGVFMAFMVIGRLVSGVHWFSDIVGGILLSAGLVMLYYSVCKTIKR